MKLLQDVGKGEYLPVKAYENRFYIASREQGMYVLEGKAIIEKESKDGSNYRAQVKTLDAEYTVFELPYIYYPGYRITLDSLELKCYETENGFLGFVLGKEESGRIEVKYTGTSAMKLSMFITINSTVFGIVYLLELDKKILKNIKRKKVNKKEEKEMKEVKENTGKK